QRRRPGRSRHGRADAGTRVDGQRSERGRCTRAGTGERVVGRGRLRDRDGGGTAPGSPALLRTAQCHQRPRRRRRGCRARAASRRDRRRGRGGARVWAGREPSRGDLRGHRCPAAHAPRPGRCRADQGLPRDAHGARGGCAHGPLRRGGWLMLYDLLVPLAKDSILFNVFRYITFRTAMATVTAIVISFVLGPWLIGRLRALQRGGETIREDTPERHRSKAGTPTMGGLVILAALLISTLLWTNLHNRYVWVLILATAGFAVIGLLDDWRKLKTRKGISAKQTFGPQILLVTGLV